MMDSSAIFGNSPADALVIIDKTEQNMDMFYLSRFFVPDPCIYILTRTDSTLIVNDLEYGRAKKEAHTDNVIRLSELNHPDFKSASNLSIMTKKLLAYLKIHNIKNILVQETFPIRFAEELRSYNIHIEYRLNPCIALRASKTDEEISIIQNAVEATETAVTGAIDLIRKSKIDDGFLYLDGEKLTAERIKSYIAQNLLSHNYLAMHTIIACGAQGCEPHNQGSGPIRAHQPIILDVFPRSVDQFYFADMTRTVVKGTPDPYVEKMFQAVKNAFDTAVKMIKPGVAVKQIHSITCETLSKYGFKTGMLENSLQGFIHSTGHGVGLEIHEAPRLANTDEILEVGNVVTVEPGLYYRKYGGVRLEDIIVVTKNGYKNLNRLQKYLVIN